MAFFSNLAKMVRKQKPMMANRRGGFLGRLSNMMHTRPQMMERMRNLRSMRGMGQGMFNPNMQFGIMGLNPMMARSMKARMMGLPDPKDFDANNLPLPQPGQRSDIMPRDPGFGVNMPKRPPIMPSALGMKAGGEAKKYPNEGLAALAEEAPEVVERMGYAPGGSVMKPLSKLAGSAMVAGVDKDMTQAISEQQQFDRIAANQAYERFYDSQPSNVQAYLPAPVTNLQAQSEVGDDTVSFGGQTLPMEFLQAGTEVFDNPMILTGPIGKGLGALARIRSDARGESMESRPKRLLEAGRILFGALGKGLGAPSAAALVD